MRIGLAVLISIFICSSGSVFAQDYNQPWYTDSVVCTDGFSASYDIKEHYLRSVIVYNGEHRPIHKKEFQSWGKQKGRIVEERFNVYDSRGFLEHAVVYDSSDFNAYSSSTEKHVDTLTYDYKRDAENRILYYKEVRRPEGITKTTRKRYGPEGRMIASHKYEITSRYNNYRYDSCVYVQWEEKHHFIRETKYGKTQVYRYVLEPVAGPLNFIKYREDLSFDGNWIRSVPIDSTIIELLPDNQTKIKIYHFGDSSKIENTTDRLKDSKGRILHSYYRPFGDRMPPRYAGISNYLQEFDANGIKTKLVYHAFDTSQNKWMPSSGYIIEPLGRYRRKAKHEFAANEGMLDQEFYYFDKMGLPTVDTMYYENQDRVEHFPKGHLYGYCKHYTKMLTTNINDLPSIKPLNLYPNPTSSTLQFENLDGALQVIRVIDMQGNSLFLEATEVNQVDVSSLPSGNYSIWIETEAERYFGRFVKVQ